MLAKDVRKDTRDDQKEFLSYLSRKFFVGELEALDSDSSAIHQYLILLDAS